MTVDRSTVKTPTLPKEVAQVPGIGEVIVRGLLMSEQMAITAAALNEKAQPGETDDQARLRARSMRVALTLSKTVILDDGKPLWTAEEWDVFGSRNPDAALDIYNVANRLNGEDDEASEKN